MWGTEDAVPPREGTGKRKPQARATGYREYSAKKWRVRNRSSRKLCEKVEKGGEELGNYGGKKQYTDVRKYPKISYPNFPTYTNVVHFHTKLADIKNENA